MGILALIGSILLFVLIMFIFTTRIGEKYEQQQRDTYVAKANSIKEVFSKLKLEDILAIIVKAIIVFVLLFAFNYFVLVRINLRYVGILFYTGLFIIMVLNLSYKNLKISSDITNKISGGIVGVAVVIMIVVYGIFGGRVFLHADAYSELITIEEDEFGNDVETVDVTTLPIVDKTYGRKLGSLKLGEHPGIGSEFEPGKYSDIIYNGKQFLVAPLEYRGIFKWINNRNEGTPGYIMIDKVTAETTLVNMQATDGKGMQFTPSAYFQQDLERHAYMNGMNNYRLETNYFEIDESGHPYYVLQYSLPTIFINGGRDIAKIAVVDAVTGEIGIYDPDEVPDWIESVYPSPLVLQQLNYWGSLQDGWLNSFLAQRGVLQTSFGKRTIMNADGLYYFTGLTSAGSDESTIGFVYMNTRTKESKLYKFPGATENAAMNKTLTLIPQNNIFASFPIPLNVSDSPTYFILIKGEDGRIIRYVFMNVQDLEINGIKEKKINAYNDYLLNLGTTNQSNLTDVTGTITDISSYVVEGNTIYWVEIDNDVVYLINVSSFDIGEMRYFMMKEVGEEISFRVQEFTIIDFNEGDSD